MKAVRAAIERPSPLVATVALKGGGFISQVKSRADVKVLEVTRANRDELPGILKERIGACGSLPGCGGRLL